MDAGEPRVLLARQLVTFVQLLVEVFELFTQLTGPRLLRLHHVLVPAHQLFVCMDGGLVPVELVLEFSERDAGQHSLGERSDRFLVLVAPALQLSHPRRMLLACREVLGTIMSVPIGSTDFPRSLHGLKATSQSPGPPKSRTDRRVSRLIREPLRISTTRRPFRRWATRKYEATVNAAAPSIKQ